MVEQSKTEIEIKENKVYIKMAWGNNYPCQTKALRENGFECRNGVYVANITPQNALFVQLLTGRKI